MGECTVKINTYQSMNEKIKDLLRLGDIQDAPYDFYAAQRIEELEQKLNYAELQLIDVLTRLKAEQDAHNALRQKVASLEKLLYKKESDYDACKRLDESAKARQ